MCVLGQGLSPRTRSIPASAGFRWTPTAQKSIYYDHIFPKRPNGLLVMRMFSLGLMPRFYDEKQKEDRVPQGHGTCGIRPNVLNSFSSPVSLLKARRVQKEATGRSSFRYSGGLPPFPLLYFMITRLIIYLRLTFRSPLHSVQVYSASSLLLSRATENYTDVRWLFLPSSLNSGQTPQAGVSRGEMSALRVAAVGHHCSYRNASSESKRQTGLCSCWFGCCFFFVVVLFCHYNLACS